MRPQFDRRYNSIKYDSLFHCFKFQIELSNSWVDPNEQNFRLVSEVQPCNVSDEHSVEWNSVGDSLFYESFNFPIVQLSDKDDIWNVRHCISSLNEPRDKLTSGVYPLCSASINTFQFSSGSTPVCMRRSQRARIIGSLTADLSNSSNSHFVLLIGG